jgi:hypothetical protein
VKNVVRVFYIAAWLVSHIRPTKETLVSDSNTSPRLGVLDDMRAEQVIGLHSSVMAKGCTSYVSNDTVGIVWKPRYALVGVD